MRWRVLFHLYFKLSNFIHPTCIVISNFFGFVLCGVFHPTPEIFTHMQTSLLPLKGWAWLTYARQSWPLSSEGSLACLSYFGTGHNGHLRTLTPIAERLALELSLPFLRTRSVAAGIEHQTFRLPGQRSERLRHRRGLNSVGFMETLKVAHLRWNMFISFSNDTRLYHLYSNNIVLFDVLIF